MWLNLGISMANDSPLLLRAPSTFFNYHPPDLNSVLHNTTGNRRSQRIIFLIHVERRILIVSFLNHIQEKNVGRQRNAGDGAIF